MLLNALMLIIYILLNVIIIWQINSWINKSFGISKKSKRIFHIIAGIVVSVMSSTIMIWMLLPSGKLSVSVIRAGNYWLGFFIEFLTVIIAAQILLCVIRLLIKKKSGDFSALFHRIYGVAVLAAALFLTVAGCISARKINTNTYEVTIDKTAAVKELKAVLVADTHLGYSIGCSQIQNMVNKINETDPDIVIVAGDIFDNSFDALDDPEKLASIFRQIKSEYGVYAVLGNHDVDAQLVGGFTVGGSRLRDPRMDEFIKNCNMIEMLDDTVTIADDSIYLIGRIDGEETGDGKERKTIEELTEKLDKSKPIFVINHEPIDLDSYADNDVDVLFSGHTHNGQTFPLNLLMPLLWKNAHGCVKTGDMYSLVTSGVGLYGPYMRVFTEAEVMEINIHFK